MTDNYIHLVFKVKAIQKWQHCKHCVLRKTWLSIFPLFHVSVFSLGDPGFGKKVTRIFSNVLREPSEPIGVFQGLGVFRGWGGWADGLFADTLWGMGPR